MSNVFRVKPLDRLIDESTHGAQRLARTLGPMQLTSLGIGAIIGAGLFSTVGTAAAGGADHVGAGPALVMSFVLTAIACGFAALCYAEFAVDGAGLGLGLHLRLRDARRARRVDHRLGPDHRVRHRQRRRRHLVVRLLSSSCCAAWHSTSRPGSAPTTAPRSRRRRGSPTPQRPARLAELAAQRPARGARRLRRAAIAGIPIIFNLPAFLIVALVTVVLVRGVSESAWFNTAMVVLKLVIIAFFLIVGAIYVKPENWTPFAPNGMRGHLVRRRHHLLRLHRLRRRVDRGRGDAQPAARHADRASSPA